MHMLHHLSFAVADIEVASTFYDAALSPLGYKRVYSAPDFVGYGVEEGKDKFAIASTAQIVTPPAAGFHLAFSAADQSAVDAFYRAAIQHGGTDNGAPGLRDEYGPDYYAAFVIDPDGYHIEAVINKRG